jgi:hypothetical protein
MRRAVGTEETVCVPVALLSVAKSERVASYVIGRAQQFVARVME